MKYSILFTVFLLFSHFVAWDANAEYCDMIGCDGEKRWIYVPKSQYEHNKVTKYSEEYEFDRSNRLFEEDELPKVGQVVTLNVNVLSFRSMPNPNSVGIEGEQWSKIRDAEEKPHIYYNKSKVIRINNTAYQGTNHFAARRGHWDLNAGMKIRILKYQHIDNVLFAWVEIEKS